MDRREEGDREWGEWNGEDEPLMKALAEQKSDWRIALCNPAIPL
jgi:hypothetical protein